MTDSSSSLSAIRHRAEQERVDRELRTLCLVDVGCSDPLFGYEEIKALVATLVAETFDALDSLAVLEAHQTTQTWQPRDTAPEDNTAFRAYGPELVHPDFNPLGQVEACFDGERFIGAVWDGQFDCWNTVAITFTHWQSFPPAPSPKGETP